MKYATLCSGIDGFGVGFDRAEMECVFQCESDKTCLTVLARHWPNIPKTSDVNDKATRRELIRLRPDVIAFGSPCQDLSVAGRRAGLSGQRSGLFFACVGLCFACEAPWVVWENVPGVFSSNGGHDFASVLEAFTGAAFEVPKNGWRNEGVAVGPLYSVAWCVLDAQWFGLAQRRNRVFLVASLGRRSGPYEVLFEPESVQRDSPPSREAGARVADTVGTRIDRGGTGREARGGGLELVNCLDAHMGMGGVDDNAAQGGHIVAEAFQCHGSNVGPMGTLRQGNGNTAGGVPFVASAITSREGNGPDSDVTTTLVAFAQNQRDEVRDLNDLAGALASKPGMKQQTYVAHTLRAEGFDASEDGTGRGTPLVAATLRSRQHSPGTSMPGRGGEDDQNLVVPIDMRQASRGSKMTNNRAEGSSGGAPGTGIGEAGDQSPTIGITHPPAVAFQSSQSGVREQDIHATLDSNNGSRRHNGAIVPTGVRRLTPTECERLQGFPDGHTAGHSDSARYRMLGNAVAVPVALWIGRRIMDAAKERGSNP